jgi:hypothetical protein
MSKMGKIWPREGAQNKLRCLQGIRGEGYWGLHYHSVWNAREKVDLGYILERNHIIWS